MGSTVRRAPGRSGSGQPARLEALLPRLVAVTGHDVRALAVGLGDRLDELGAAVDQADAVVGAVRGRQGAVRDEPVDQGAPSGLGVVVDAVAVRQEAQGVGHGAQLGAEGVGRPAEVPADRAGRDAGEDDPGLPDPAEHRVELVHPPDGEQVGHRATVDPDHVLLEQVALDVLEVRHREQVQVGEVEARHAPRLVQVVGERPLVAAGRAEHRDARSAPGHAGQLDRVVHEAVELEAGAVTEAVAAGRREDRGLV
jgi:hypothetical protein